MDKKFMSVPKNDFDKIILVANMASETSGKPTTQKEILDSIEKRGLIVTAEQIKYIKENFV